MSTPTTDTPNPTPAPGPSKADLDQLYRTVNGKFHDSAELRLEAGREMLAVLFDGDAAFALSAEAQTHAPWLAFRKLAGGRKVKPLKRHLRGALRLAAFETLVSGGFYANLDVSLREELLPVSDPDEIRAAAQLCIENNWGLRGLRRHVKSLTARPAPTAHAAVAKAAVGPLERVVSALDSEEGLSAFLRAVERLPRADREQALATLDRAHALLTAARRKLR